MTYSLDFRKRALKVRSVEGLSFNETARRFHISKAALFRWSKKIEAKKHRNKTPTKIDMQALKNDIEKYPDSYCYERAVRFGVSASGIRDAQYRLGISYKKNATTSKNGSRKKIYISQ
jgi:transposase